MDDLRGVKRFVGRVNTLPFESLLAVIAIASCIFGLLHLTYANPLDAVLGRNLTIAFELGYGVAGVLMLLGLGFAKGNVEAAGLVLLGSSGLVRCLVLWQLLGFTRDVAVALVFYVLIVGACVARLRSLLRHEVIIRGTET